MPLLIVVAGGIYRLETGAKGVALSGLDADGDVRLAPVASDGNVRMPGDVGLSDADFSGPALEGVVVRLGKLGICPAATLTAECAALSPTGLARVLRQAALLTVAPFYQVAHAPRPFVAGQSPVPVSGRCFGAREIETLVDASLDFWLTTGRYNDLFEDRFEAFLSLPHVLTTNSGSSANLLAVSALTSPSLGERRLKPGDEVITVAAGFPTTVTPLLQNGLVPVFVDVKIPTYNIEPTALEAAYSSKTRAVVLAHTLGNPFDLDAVLDFVEAHDLWLIEDCCDALGSYYVSSQGHGQGLVGNFGHIATFSFYPAHHITMGEGGAVATRDAKLKKLLASFRDWGRDCWCPPGRDNTCQRRWNWQLGSLPYGYDHKYIYSHLGYNLKITDMQAAVGVAQLERLPEAIASRRRNFAQLHEGLADLTDRLILPQATPGANPSWFGFPLTLREGSGLDRERLLQELNAHKIGTRLLFAGNLTRQPAMAGQIYRLASDLAVTDQIMTSTFWVGVYPGLTSAHVAYMIDTLHSLVRSCASC